MGVHWYYPDHMAQQLLTEPFDEPVEVKEAKNGVMKVPQTPGLGLKINDKTVAKYKVG